MFVLDSSVIMEVRFAHILLFTFVVVVWLLIMKIIRFLVFRSGV